MRALVLGGTGVFGGRLCRNVGHALAGIPLPRFCWARIVAAETQEKGRFRFDVEIGRPGIGRLVRYRGFLTGR